MGIPLRIVEPPGWEAMETGMMWRDPAGDRDGRECWTIVLPQSHPDIGTPGHPSRILWTTTDRAYNGSGMWVVAGTAPGLTVTPSIDVLRFVKGPDGKHIRDGSYWHGFITNGELVG